MEITTRVTDVAKSATCPAGVVILFEVGDSYHGCINIDNETGKVTIIAGRHNQINRTSPPTRLLAEQIFRTHLHRCPEGC